MTKRATETRSADERFVFRIDYLAVTVRDESARTLCRELVRVLGEAWEEQYWERIQSDELRERALGPVGSYLEENRVQGWVHFAVKGEGCGSLGCGKVLELVRTLHERFGKRFTASRLDVAWDDHQKKITPDLIAETFWNKSLNQKRAEAVTWAKSGAMHRDYGGKGGCCFEIGKRKSKRFLRVYDKAAESEGKIDAMRSELMLRDEWATKLLRELCSIEEQAAAGIAMRYLVGFVDFRSVGSYRSHSERRGRLGWWNELVGEAQAVRLAPEDPSSFAEWQRQFVRRTSGGFKVLVAAHSGDVSAAAATLLEPSREVRNRRHRRMIDEFGVRKKKGLDSADA